MIGEAGTGIGELIAQALVKQSQHEVGSTGSPITLAEAQGHCYFMDSKGLICASRPDAAAGTLAHHKVCGCGYRRALVGDTWLVSGCM